MDYLTGNFFSENQDKENSYQQNSKHKTDAIKSLEFNMFEYYINN